ncbi:MAG: glycoside hydrolase family 3 N-terminal domain-containing protein [Enterocloster sp.]
MEGERWKASWAPTNRTNGEPCCGSKTLIQDILKNKWKFDGYFVSDCWAIKDFHENHQVTDAAAESASMALKNGCDINCGNTYLHIFKRMGKGADIREISHRLRYMPCVPGSGLGCLTENAHIHNIPYETVGCRKHRRLAIKAAEKSMVLLKNDNILPLNRNMKKLAVIGPNADSRWPLVPVTMELAPRYVTVLEELKPFWERIPESTIRKAAAL